MLEFRISIISKIYCFSSINNSIQAETKMFIHYKNISNRQEIIKNKITTTTIIIIYLTHQIKILLLKSYIKIRA